MTVDLDSMERATRECVERTLAAYIGTALWSSAASREEGDEPDHLDAWATPDDLAPETREAMLEDVAAFLETCWAEGWDLSELEPEQIGHDFWLTRNHHGAGFWDRGLGELGDRLTALAHPYGACDLYVADGRIYAV